MAHQRPRQGEHVRSAAEERSVSVLLHVGYLDEMRRFDPEGWDQFPDMQR